ncbi:MAG: hypothetical protein IPK19_17440 [Chloroflexi bacterium]|nr:hypothetical protein [Chloroflexota bacterium]
MESSPPSLGGTDFIGDGSVATLARLSSPSEMMVGPDGAVYIGDTANYRVRRVGVDSIITTVAGNGTPGFSGDGGPATAARLVFAMAWRVGTDDALYIADTPNHRIRRVGTDGIITTIAGNGTQGFSGDGGSATAAALAYPAGIVVGMDEVRSLRRHGQSPHPPGRTDGIITTVAGNGTQDFSGDNGLATAASFQFPGAWRSTRGTLYIADTGNHRIRRVGPAGIITTVAGNGSQGFGGDGGPATEASLAVPAGVVFGPDGVLYIADWDNHRIRRVGTDGIITTVAGNGIPGFGGDGGPSTAARLNLPADVAVGADGALYISDYYNDRIRRVVLVEPAAVNAVLLLQGRPPAPHDQWIAQVTVTVVPSTGGTPVFHGAITTDDVGAFSHA